MGAAELGEFKETGALSCLGGLAAVDKDEVAFARPRGRRNAGVGPELGVDSDLVSPPFGAVKVFQEPQGVRKEVDVLGREDTVEDGPLLGHDLVHVLVVVDGFVDPFRQRFAGGGVLLAILDC